ncbi:MAG: amidohydrolase family protein [Clostridiaceae bacterium]|nr:amidohydrolase family protein [Clostridiaceae bacterium]
MAFEIIDAHMHPFTCKEEIVNNYTLDTAPADIGADLARCGIGRFAGSVIYRPTNSFAEVSRANRDALALRDRYGSRYIPGIHIHPDYVAESCEELTRLHAQGVRLIGELVPYMMGWTRYTCPGALEIFSLAQELGMTVSVHPTVPEDLDALCAAFPHMNIIVAHPGEYNDYLRNLERLERYPNAYLDICGTGLFRNRMLWYGVNRVGAERFLFGTDYPVCNPAMQVAAVEYERLTDAERELIFAGNFKRLLNLE